MSGSIRSFTYETDGGTFYAVNLDESNGEACGFNNLSAATGLGLPRNIQMRYANCVHPTVPALRRQFPIGGVAFFNGLRNGTNNITTDDPSNPGTDVTWRISSLRGEKQRLYSPIDTGLNDGDSPN